MKKFKSLGVLFVAVGIGAMVVGGCISVKAQEGIRSLEAVYETQNVIMSYDEEGNFTDRGSIEEGTAILNLLTEDWRFPLNEGNLDPNDPLVNTPDELMVQYARISYHVTHGTQTVELAEDVEYNGEFFPAGSYEFEIDGRYWQDFDRSHPIEGPAREMAWSATAHALLANLAAGTATHNLVMFVVYFGYLVICAGVFLVVSGGLLLKKE